MASTSDSGYDNARAAATALVKEGAPKPEGNATLSAWKQRWQQFAPRERRMIALAGAVLGGFLLFTVAIRPAWTTVRSAPARLSELDTQFQQMQRMAGESKELRGSPRMAPAQ